MTHNLLDMHAPRNSSNDIHNKDQFYEGTRKSTFRLGDPLGSRISNLTVKTYKKMNESGYQN